MVRMPDLSAAHAGVRESLEPQGVEGGACMCQDADASGAVDGADRF